MQTYIIKGILLEFQSKAEGSNAKVSAIKKVPDVGHFYNSRKFLFGNYFFVAADPPVLLVVLVAGIPNFVLTASKKISTLSTSVY